MIVIRHATSIAVFARLDKHEEQSFQSEAYLRARVV
jgi:hypothetical protein